jgi:membrane-bound lytic murein transglycosylase MltF
VSKGEWGPLIAHVLPEVWPDLPDGEKWIAAQVKAESDGNPNARSASGAVGLLQLMPGTATEMNVMDRKEPRENLVGGIGYLKKQYDAIGHTVDIPEHLDRLAWALASYNVGRGYVMQALLLAERDGLPNWRQWEHSKCYLFHRSCTRNGKYPDYHRVWNYVSRIQEAVKATH